MKLIPQEKIEEMLDWAYDKALNGTTGFDSAYKLAEDYKKDYPNDLEKQIDSFINWQCAKSAISGAITSIGGFVILAATLPINITTVLAIQFRMIITIAILCGYDVKNDKIKTLIYACSAKQPIYKILKEAGIQITKKVGVKLIQRIPISVIRKINKIIGFKLITKFGQKGIINLGKAIPVLGMGLGAAIDAVSTKTVGKFSKKILMSQKTKNDFIEVDVLEEK